MYSLTPWHTTTQCRASAAADTAEQRDEAAAVVTADAQTQARLPADPEAAARSAVAAAALAQVSLSERRPKKHTTLCICNGVCMYLHTSVERWQVYLGVGREGGRNVQYHYLADRLLTSVFVTWWFHPSAGGSVG